MRQKIVSFIVTSLLVAGWSVSGIAGPISDYYVTSATNVYQIRGDSVVNSWSMVQGNEYPIVVSGTVRTGSYYGGNSGHEYTLSGSYTGTIYPPTIPGLHHDGTTDGVHNYTTSYWDENNNLSNKIWRTDTEWANPVLIFTTLNVRPSGITYDPLNGTLWVSEWGIDHVNDRTITDYAMDGTVLSSFSTYPFYATSLALDPADGTLWMGSYTEPGRYYQYSRAGAFLGSSYYAELAGVLTLGGEIARSQSIPEPGTLALLGVALVGLMWVRQRGKAQFAE